MSFERSFKIFSYASVFCGFLSLWVASAVGFIGSAVFASVLLAAWFVEGTRWQIPERVGTFLIVLALPVFFVLWRLGLFVPTGPESVLPSVLARLILTLTALKMLQEKSDRDWVFLLIMSFFQVLLAAGMSISALYLFSFILFTFSVVCTIILFEMRKTDRAVNEKSGPGGATHQIHVGRSFRARYIPVTASILMFAIVLICTPMFFLIPRVGGAGLGADPSGVSTRTGFSETVRLGGIGKIQQNDEVVMRVRLDGSDVAGNLKWRGMAHDTFDGQSWSRSRGNTREPKTRGDRDIIQVDYATGKDSLLLQTIYLEPLDSPVLFAAPRAVGVQGNFTTLVKDLYGGISFSRSGERISYKVLSDTSIPNDQELRADDRAYPIQADNYLQLPDNLDPRIERLARDVTHGNRSRFDAARAIEAYLQTQFGYTLEQKAGGPDPLADFLFNVREGHCEYFATAMVMMLRTQGIAARLATGFQQGDYNETADVYVVRQRHAHAWVEVFFPGEDAWVAFDPTPAAGRSSNAVSGGISGRFGKYMEALEMFWIQYFVAFDNQEQRSLFTSVRRGFVEYQAKTSDYVDTFQMFILEWWKDVRGENGFEERAAAIGYALGAFIGAVFGILGTVLLYKRLKHLSIWQRLSKWFRRDQAQPSVDFYERMIRLLENRGIARPPNLTPLEFAMETGIPEVVQITDRYNAVRFGLVELTSDERARIETWLGTFDAKS